jgi:NADH:ubiquinone oxidoreductase subunit 6 (subunit J)
LVATGLCAIQALRSRTGLLAAGWLAGASALTAATLASLGGIQVAVLELSVGAGLVTILLVYAISLAGGEPEGRSVVSGWLAAVLTTVLGALLIFIIAPTVPLNPLPSPVSQPTFANAIWESRQLDTLLQVAIIFTCGMSLIGFLAAVAQTKTQPVSKETESAPVSPVGVAPLPLAPFTPIEKLATPEVKQ